MSLTLFRIPGEPLGSLSPACPAESKRRPAWEVPARPAANGALTCLQLDNHVFFENILKPLVLRKEFGVLRLLNGALAAPSLTTAARAVARACFVVQT